MAEGKSLGTKHELLGACAEAWSINCDKLKGTKYEDKYEVFSNSFLDATKKLSQLIAKSWLPETTYPEGRKFRNILLGIKRDEDNNAILDKDGKSQPDGLSNVARSNAIVTFCKDQGICDDAMLQVLADYIILVDWSAFRGKTLEGVLVTLPYPPRPGVVTNQELEDWVHDNTDRYFPTTAYIPLSCWC